LEQALFPPVSRQMPPGTWLPVFVEQTPILMLPLVDSVQWTWPVPLPQHSLSVIQRLLMILQPRPGWQTSTPVSAHGPQLRLQQLPQPLQRTPSCVHWPVPVVEISVQVPSVAPAAIEQKPPQQSRLREHTSPGWMQNEEPSTHLPLEHRPEQQPPATPPSPAVAVQGLPAVRQAVLRGLQVPPVQVPLQQADESVQAALSAVQLEALLQVLVAVLHKRLQQSVFTAHELPGPLHLETDEAQVLATGSHDWEQHSAFEVHAVPATVHLTPTPPPPPVPPAPVTVPPFPPPPVEVPEPDPHPITMASRATMLIRPHAVDVALVIATLAEQPACRANDRAPSRLVAGPCTAQDSRCSISFASGSRLSILVLLWGADALSAIRRGS
jgi:hypothetical protein